MARAVASVLPPGWRIIGVDSSEAALLEIRNYRKGIELIHTQDVCATVRELVGSVDVFVNLLPGNVGLEVAWELVRCRATVVDVSFWEGDRKALDRLARDKGVFILVDCGIAPGVPNFMLGALLASGKRVEDFRYWVGGLPRVRRWPHEYAAVFSPVDVLAEYVRPARAKLNGEVVEFDPLTGPSHFIEVEGVGTLEAFPTDGLRTLLELPVPNMIEYTLRYPGHRAVMLALREMGFLREEVLSFTAKILADSWRLFPGEREFTYLRAEARTSSGEVMKLTIWDEGPDGRGLLSMSRCTGFTAAFIVLKVVEGRVRALPGVYGLEGVADRELFMELLEFFRSKGMQVEWSARESNP